MLIPTPTHLSWTTHPPVLIMERMLGCCSLTILPEITGCRLSRTIIITLTCHYALQWQRKALSPSLALPCCLVLTVHQTQSRDPRDRPSTQMKRMILLNLAGLAVKSHESSLPQISHLPHRVSPVLEFTSLACNGRFILLRSTEPTVNLSQYSRTRKIRCDGAKPQCHNCSRRSKNGDDCSYDAVPKRRGPDKTPGARQRMAREARAGSEGGVIAARRRRRNKSEMSSNTRSDQTVNTDLGPHANPPISFSNIPAPVIDPQLTGMSLFPTEASGGSNSFQPLPLNVPTDAVALVAPSDHEALYHMTSTQVPT